MVSIYTDGATLGYNGKLGTVSVVGLGVYMPHLKQDGFFSKRTDGISNNEAEFKALIFAMDIAIDKQIKEVKFFLDSMIVVNRANGSKPKKKKYQNERMDDFQNIVLEKSKLFDEVSFDWIPREENCTADRLSKNALSSRNLL